MRGKRSSTAKQYRIKKAATEPGLARCRCEKLVGPWGIKENRQHQRTQIRNSALADMVAPPDGG